MKHLFAIALSLTGTCSFAADLSAYGSARMPAAYQAYAAGEAIPGLPNLAKPVFLAGGSAVCGTGQLLIQGQEWARAIATHSKDCVLVPRPVRVKVIARPSRREDYVLGYAFGAVQIEIIVPESANISEGGGVGVITAWTTVSALDKIPTVRPAVPIDKTTVNESAARERRVADLRRTMQGESVAASPPDTAPSSGPSSGYAGRLRAVLKPNIQPASPIAGNPAATVEVRLASNGTIVSQRLVKSSGSSVWDDAVMRGVEVTHIFPKDEGRIYTPMTLEFHPQD